MRIFHDPRKSAYRLEWICDNHYLGMSDEEMDFYEEQKQKWKEWREQTYGWWSPRRWAVEFNLLPKVQRKEHIDPDALREICTLSEIIEQYVPLRRFTNGSRMGRCPFHDDKGPSLSVEDSKGLFHCFGCQASGNVYHFLMKIEGLTFPQAVKTLASFYGK